METIKADKVLDARGLSCPMPIVKARKEVGELAAGQILKVLSTDRGSVRDFQGWVASARNLELVAQQTESIDGKDVYIHYVSKKG